MASPVVLSGNSLRVTAPTGGTTVGVPLDINGLFGLPNDTVAAAADVTVDLSGVWQLVKTAGVTFAEGDPCYWKVSTLAVTSDPTGRFIGHAADFGGAASALTTMRVRIDPSAHLGSSSGVAKLTLDPTGDAAQRPIGSYFGDSMPDNAIVVRSWYDVLTTFADGVADAATIALGVETDDVGGIVVANDIADVGNPWDAGLHEAIQDGTVANFSTKTTAAGRRLQADVAGVALTAGKLVLVADWVTTA